jgi:hypothetical protein
MDADLHQWHPQNEYGNRQREDYTTGWAQYSTMPMHEYMGLGFGNPTYIAPGPPPPISVTLMPTTVTPVTPVTTSGDSTPRRVLTDDERRRMCEYHEKHPGVKQTDIGGTSPALYPPLIL